MAEKKIAIDPPVIAGILSDSRTAPPRQFKHELKAINPKISLLPFCVKREHLRNTVTCMQLMDIVGLLVLGDHQRDIARHINRVPGASAHADRIDLITRNRSGFVGHNIMACVLADWLRKSLPRGSKKRRVSIIGEFPCESAVRAALKSEGYSISKLLGAITRIDSDVVMIGKTTPSQIKRALTVLGSRSDKFVLIELCKGSRRHASGPKTLILNEKKLMSLYYHTGAKLLASGTIKLSR